MRLNWFLDENKNWGEFTLSGNISLNLPGTRIVSVGMGKRTGLFGIKIINHKIKKNNLSNYISTKLFDVREKLPFEDNSIEACYSHMLYCMALTTNDLEKL